MPPILPSQAIRQVAASRDGQAWAVIGDPIARFGTLALMALIATIIFIMVVKPHG